LFMCESLNPGKRPLRKVSSPMDDDSDQEEKIEEAFTKLSGHTIAELIENEPDSYSIKDVKVRYK
jgi:hypothetical protein